MRQSGTEADQRQFDGVQEDCILSKIEVTKLANFSIRHLERLEEEGIAPPRVHLGARRIGYWRSDVIAWLRARTSPSKLRINEQTKAA